jgi:F-type H+-transporting ATPase subunit b
MRASRIMTAVLVLLASSPMGLLAQGEAAGGGGGAAMFNINLGLSLWTVVVFLALVLVLAKFAWRPILTAVEARESGIQSALDEAARRNAEAADLLEEHRKQLADARRQAGEILAEGKAAGDKVRKEIEEKARSEGQAIIERARQEIERERDAAVESLRREAVDLALSAASRLMSENLTQAKDRQLVERYLDELGRADESRGARA